MFKSVSPHMVAIKPFLMPEEGTLLKSEKTKEVEMKKQNRGEVVRMGAKCDQWIQEGDTVSFYRNASTPVKDDEGTEYELVNEAHILAKF